MPGFADLQRMAALLLAERDLRLARDAAFAVASGLAPDEAAEARAATLPML